VQYLEEIDYKAPEFGDLYDELPLWSAPFGLMLLEHVGLRPGMTILDVGAEQIGVRAFLSLKALTPIFRIGQRAEDFTRGGCQQCHLAVVSAHGQETPIDGKGHAETKPGEWGLVVSTARPGQITLPKPLPLLRVP
jgi:hypothetical protein